MWTLPHAALIASVVVYCIATHGPVWLPAWLCAALPHAACAGVASYGRSLYEEIVGSPRTSPPVFLYDAQCHGTPEPHLIATRGPVSGCQCCGVLYCHTRLVYCIATHGPMSVLPAWLCAALPHEPVPELTVTAEASLRGLWVAPGLVHLFSFMMLNVMALLSRI